MLNSRPFRYHNDPGKTAEALRGTYATVGDMGWVDEDGYLYIADRRGDLILVGGVNVYPAEVEGMLSRHPKVRDVAVIGKPDADLGQAVHAVVQPRDEVTDLDALAAELSAFLEDRLSSQKRPRSYAFREQIPRNEAGKLLRRMLRDELEGSA
jgi:acyl-CoA synthetase (AMP-forming)/AMP-acid ligase II